MNNSKTQDQLQNKESQPSPTINSNNNNPMVITYLTPVFDLSLEYAARGPWADTSRRMMLGSHFHIILYEPAQQFGVLTDGFMPGRIHFERGTKNVPIAVQTQQASSYTRVLEEPPDIKVTDAQIDKRIIYQQDLDGSLNT